MLKKDALIAGKELLAKVKVFEPGARLEVRQYGVRLYDYCCMLCDGSVIVGMTHHYTYFCAVTGFDQVSIPIMYSSTPRGAFMKVKRAAKAQHSQYQELYAKLTHKSTKGG